MIHSIATARDSVIAAFASHGIALHVDDGTGDWSSVGGGKAIDYIDTVSKTTLADGINDFYDYKNGYDSNRDDDYADLGECEPQFNDNRNGLFHYCIFTWRLSSGAEGETTGVGVNVDGDDFALAMSVISGDIDVACTFMHELGHTLGLVPTGYLPVPFEGIDSGTYSENYQSVMNYRYSDNGIDGLPDYSDGSRPDHDHDDWGTLRLDWIVNNWNVYEG